LTFVTDVTPTILEVAGIEPNDASPELTGRSLYPVIHNQTEHIYQADEPIGLEVAGQSALFRGDMKIVRNAATYGDSKWRMFNIKTDQGEVHDLSISQPELFADMLNSYDAYTKTFKVLKMPEGYDLMQEMTRKAKVNVVKKVRPWLIGLLVLIGFLVIRKIRKGKS